MLLKIVCSCSMWTFKCIGRRCDTVIIKGVSNEQGWPKITWEEVE